MPTTARERVRDEPTAEIIDGHDAVGAAAEAGVPGDAALPEAIGVPPDPGLSRDDTVAVLEGEHPAPDDGGRLRALLAWGSAHGTISLELFGHLVGSAVDGDRHVDRAMGELAGPLGR